MTVLEKKDFKSLSPNYRKACERIIEDKGDCTNVDCVACPFYCMNRADDKMMDMCSCAPNLRVMQKFIHSKKFLEMMSGDE